MATEYQPRASTVTPSVELKRIQLLSRRLVSGELLGQYRSAFRGTGLSFADLRAYQPGDDVKHIHWKATARTGTVFVKSYEEERQLRVLLAVDNSASMRAIRIDRYGFQKALDFCAAVGSLTQQCNDLLGLTVFDNEVRSFLPPSSGPKQLHTIISRLVNLQPATTPTTDLTNALQHILSSLRRRSSVVFLVSDFLSEGFELELRKLCVTHDVVLVQLETPTHLLANNGLVSFCDAETGVQVLIDTSNSRVMTTWREAQLMNRQRLQALARSSGADHIVINDDATAPLIRLMKERAARQLR